MQDVVYSFTTYSPGNGQGVDQLAGDIPLIQSRYWKLERDASYQTFLDRMKGSNSPFLLPPHVVKEGEFRNVANMTASTVQRQSKQAHHLQQHAQQQTVLTPGHALIIEGVQIELNLNPGSGSGGVSGEAEWIIRMGWIGGAPNPLTVGNQPMLTKGIIVEVSRGQSVMRLGMLNYLSMPFLDCQIEYVPLKSMPREPNPQNALDIPVLLSTFLSSLLPLQTVTPAPQVTILTAPPQEWAAIGVDAATSQCITSRSSGLGVEDATAAAEGEPGMKWEQEERVRRVAWMLVKHLKSAGLIA
ncbi:hypothetical protein QFC19_001213 [Naganishia cerealis]|uniref:Uncharacterized protein n=1 Tax=Naganishia cerealis TaxID=610337 RepID=A0ACC2WI52_9TREE|nr:hypothetical protein QFC19_001213 [Naganishia cerealis]